MCAHFLVTILGTHMMNHYMISCYFIFTLKFIQLQDDTSSVHPIMYSKVYTHCFIVVIIYWKEQITFFNPVFGLKKLFHHQMSHITLSHLKSNSFNQKTNTILGNEITILFLLFIFKIII